MSPTSVLGQRYELIELIGTGGMSEVWRARDRRLGRDVAVKVLSGPAARDASRRRRIEREAKALAAAGHPNIVTVYDVGGQETQDGGARPYLVMELVDGPDLGAHITERGPLPTDEARGIMSGILAAVAHAHGAGIVHGDLKPANVFIGAHGPKVGDFGVARILGEETGATTVAATPRFAAPEVLRGERATQASDVYSAACLTYHLLTARAPYEGANAWEVAQKHLESPPPRVRKLRPDVPHGVDAAVARGMDKRASKRFASATEFADAIGAASDRIETVPAATGAGVIDLTAPVDAPGAQARDATEVITARPVDAARAAVLGPLAPVAAWWRSRSDRRRADERTAAGRWSPLLAALAVVVIVLLLGSLLLRERGPSRFALPDVTGETIASARALLQGEGLGVDVSYRPVTDGAAGRVLETIPAGGEPVEPGSVVHVIASAYAATPQPTVAPAANADDKDERPRGKGKGRNKKRDRD